MSHTQVFKKLSCVLLSAWLAIVWSLPPCQAQGSINEDIVDTRETDEMFLYLGDLGTLRVYNLTRLAVSNPGIVEIVNTDVNQILLVGKQAGETQFFLWDEYGKRTVIIRVLERDLELIRRRITKLLEAAEIDGVILDYNPLEGKILARGKMNKTEKEEFDKVVESFGDYLINMVQEQSDLIQIDSQITELNKTLNEILGVSWSQSFNVEETLPGFDGKIYDTFRIGDFARTTKILATVNALLTTSQARNLSRPSVTVADGEEASILVGGEVPITSTVVGDGGQTESVQYKSYGVEMSVTPKIQDDNKIEITLSVSVRDVDSGTGNTTSFATTTADTKVLLDDGQTIVIAGLIKQNELSTEKKVPFLHKIPILGLFFRNRDYNKTTDKELVISLTPRILRQKNKEKYVKSEKRPAEEIKAAAPSSGEEQPADVLNEETDVAAGSEMEFSNETVDLEAMPQILSEDVEEDDADLVAEYARKVQNKIASKITFPYEAIEQGWEGTVILSIVVLSDGTLNKADVQESSGRAIFDKDAVNTAEIVSPFDPFPVDLEMEEIEISIPVIYSQQLTSKE
ncbi:MAG TPA: TonB family protein [Candidatus Omnitrophota bacterium]|nr:TonB family protein [Candidatus Omnitrophota bacterium]